MSTAELNGKDKGRLPKDERKALLLSAALEVFTSAGYHAAKIGRAHV